jgi:uncharacterized protein (TIGR02246 family)
MLPPEVYCCYFPLTEQYNVAPVTVNHFTRVGRKLDHSVGGKTGQRGEKMTEVMRRILPYGSASSHFPAACLPIEWDNFFTIRPRAFQDLHESEENIMAVEDNKNSEEAEIKRVIEAGVEALRAKNIEGVMSCYAPEVVLFDIVPPLRYVGADALRKLWEAVFSSYQGPIGYDIADLSITVGDDVAFTHSLNRISGTMNTGQQTALWVRGTVCFRKINGKWLVVHEQDSVPVDLQTGRAALDLKP